LEGSGNSKATQKLFRRLAKSRKVGQARGSTKQEIMENVYIDKFKICTLLRNRGCKLVRRIL
jgi:hypothetical protein